MRPRVACHGPSTTGPVEEPSDLRTKPREISRPLREETTVVHLIHAVPVRVRCTGWIRAKGLGRRFPFIPRSEPKHPSIDRRIERKTCGFANGSEREGDPSQKGVSSRKRGPTRRGDLEGSPKDHTSLRSELYSGVADVASIGLGWRTSATSTCVIYTGTGGRQLPSKFYQRPGRKQR